MPDLALVGFFAGAGEKALIVVVPSLIAVGQVCRRPDENAGGAPQPHEVVDAHQFAQLPKMGANLLGEQSEIVKPIQQLVQASGIHRDVPVDRDIAQADIPDITSAR